MQVDGLLLDLLKALYNETTAAVSLKGGITSDTFATRCGVKQGCPLSCVIFNAIMDCLMRKLIATKFPGINIKWRIPRGKRHSGDVVQGSETIGLLTYADDIVIWSDKEEELKNCIECFSDISKIWGMSVNTNKTKYQVLQPSNSNERRTSCMSVGEKNLQQVENYRYLGSTIQDNAKFDSEMISRVQSAQGKLTGLNLIWKSRIISRKTKGILFKTCVIPRLTYGCSTWCLSRHNFRDLNMSYISMVKRAFLIRSTRKKQETERQSEEDAIEYLSHSEILRLAKLEPLQPTIDCRVLFYAGHIARMDSERTPNKILFGEQEGKMQRGGQTYTYAKTIRDALSRAGMPSDQTWKYRAQYKDSWNAATTEYRDENSPSHKKRRKKHGFN